MDPRELEGITAAVMSTATTPTACSAFTLPANGIISLANGDTFTLTGDSVFQPACTASVVAPRAIIATGGVSIDESSSSSTDPQVSSLRDPFYASTFPQCYALAATTFLSYTLVIMLFIAPRSFVDGGLVVLGRRGFTNGPANGVSIGGRPWLQKVAALTVAISLTIATADTVRVAEEQYSLGVQNATELQQEVLDGTQLKVIRLISDTFLWLAQAQTLIRLFPRQREKIIIKWTAFSLITLDVIFGALNSFLYDGPGNNRPQSFTDAVPALSYLFQLSLGLLYAAWVIYYSLMKKRYAYFHPSMKNISLVAILSIIALLVPVVFFILDISKPELTGWGDYVRWVGAAAASVIVWEWVERIEALEREEKKDGILGREVFDGDEMMDLSSSEFSWPRRRKGKKKSDDGDDDDGGESGRGRGLTWPVMSAFTNRHRSKSGPRPEGWQASDNNATSTAVGRSGPRFLQPPLWISRPPPAVTPVSRTDTASADSTVYAVRYQSLTESTSRTTEERHEWPPLRGDSRISSESVNRPATPPQMDQTVNVSTSDTNAEANISIGTNKPAPEPQSKGWRSLLKMGNGPRDLPAEVLPHAQSKPPRREYEHIGRWDIRERIEDFAATRADKIREKLRPSPDTESLETTIIPAPPRRGAALAQLLEEEERETNADPHSHIATAVPPTNRRMRSASNPSGIPLHPPIHRTNSSASSAASPTLSPSHRNDTFQLRPIGRERGSSPASPRTLPRSQGDVSRKASSAPRRPVDDMYEDSTGPRL